MGHIILYVTAIKLYTPTLTEPIYKAKTYCFDVAFMWAITSSIIIVNIMINSVIPAIRIFLSQSCTSVNSYCHKIQSKGSESEWYDSRELIIHYNVVTIWTIITIEGCF